MHPNGLHFYGQEDPFLILFTFLKEGGYSGGIALLSALLFFQVFAFPRAGFAGSATWNLNPTNGDWNTAGNWSAGGPPNGAADTATFGSSNTTGVSLSDFTTVDGIVFNAGASAFTITTTTVSLTVDGVGITNNSGITQHFVTGFDAVGFNIGFIVFTGTATAGNSTVFTNNLGETEFNNSASAGTGTFINNGNADGSSITGITQFNNSSNAGSGTFTSNGGTANGGLGGFTSFTGTSDAGTGSTFTSNGATVNGALGGVTTFQASSTAHAATLIANGGSNGGAGGTITFVGASSGGTSRVEVFGNGNLDIGLINQSPFSVTIGSLEGTGNVFLSNRNLTVGSNNMTKTFSGVIQDGGQGGFTGGSLTKIGSGTLSLTNSNTFTGGTLINVGTLIAAHDGALGTGNVSLTASSVTLTLQGGATNNYISNSASLSIVSGATANLNFTGAADVVSGLVLAGVFQAPGTYNASNEPSFFTGTGAITVVPEPSSWTMFSIGAAVLIGMRKLMRKRQ